MAVRVEYSPHKPAVLLGDGGLLDCAGGDRTCLHRCRIVDDQEQPSGRATERVRHETLMARAGGRDPEDRIAYGKLGDDVLPGAHDVHRACAERVGVEADRR